MIIIFLVVAILAHSEILVRAQNHNAAVHVERFS